MAKAAKRRKVTVKAPWPMLYGKEQVVWGKWNVSETYRFWFFIQNFSLSLSLQYIIVIHNYSIHQSWDKIIKRGLLHKDLRHCARFLSSGVQVDWSETYGNDSIAFPSSLFFTLLPLSLVGQPFSKELQSPEENSKLFSDVILKFWALCSFVRRLLFHLLTIKITEGPWQEVPDEDDDGNHIERKRHHRSDSTWLQGAPSSHFRNC